MNSLALYFLKPVKVTEKDTSLLRCGIYFGHEKFYDISPSSQSYGHFTVETYSCNLQQ